MNENILIIEDDLNIQDVIKAFLSAEDFKVVTANDGLEGIKLFNTQEFDLVILDIMLPNLNGYEVSKAIRARADIPIIMLTSLNEEKDQVKGFDFGADDYITKPFSYVILIKRVKTLLRRFKLNKINAGANANIYTFHELKIDIDAYKVFIDDKEVILTTKEFEIVRELIINSKKVITRETLLNNLWGYDYYGDTRIIDTHIKNIRRKLNTPYVKTIKGVGYKIDD